jgi:hypothetical protein
MTEKQENYLPMEQQIRQLEQRLQAINTDPTASHWLKRAAAELWDRDVVDALNDLDVLRELLEAKHHAHVLTLKRMITPDDGIRH